MAAFLQLPSSIMYSSPGLRAPLPARLSEVRSCGAPSSLIYYLKDTELWLIKKFFDKCSPSLKHGRNCCRERFGSFSVSQSKGHSKSASPGRRYFSRSFSTFNLEGDDLSDQVIFEEGIFEDASNSEEAEVSDRTPDEVGSEVEEDGLIPKEWRPLQLELNKTKAEKKKELLLQEQENFKLKEIKYQLRREKVEIAENSTDRNTILPGQPGGNTLWNDEVDKKWDQQFQEHKQVVLENLENRGTTSESVVTVASLASNSQRAMPTNPRLEVGESTLEDVARKLEERIAVEHQEHGTQLARKNKTDSDLDPLFTPDEKSSLKRGRPDFSKMSCEKWLPLHTLVASGQFFFLDQLLKQDTDVDAVDKDGYTPLQRAVLSKKETAVNQLLRAGADAHVRDKDGASLLHFSVQTGSMNLVRLLLKSGVDVNSSDEYGWTPLHLAVLTGRADIVRLLLVSGADKTLRNKDGLVPFDICLALGKGFNSYEVAKALKKLPKVNAITEIH